MLRSNPEMRQEAMAALKGNWMSAIVAAVVCMVVSSALTSIPVLNSASVLVTIPLAYGTAIWFLRFKRTGAAEEISTLFIGFKDFVRVFVTMLLVNLYTLLWALLLIVPGIIKSLAYSLTPYILEDEPEMKGNAAIEKSMAMMEGHKKQLFLMSLNFALWILISCGIGLIFVLPYIQTAMATFYEEVKKDYASRA